MIANCLTALSVDHEQSDAEVQRFVGRMSRLMKEAQKGHKAQTIRTNRPGVTLVTFHDGWGYRIVNVLEGDEVVGFSIFEDVPVPGGKSGALVTPHSSYTQKARGKGYASSVYTWALSHGVCLLSASGQTKGANALWAKLGTKWPWVVVELRRNRFLIDLGSPSKLSQNKLNHKDTRLVLLGNGWDRKKFFRTYHVI